MKTRRSTSYPTRTVFPKAETSIYNRLFVIAKKRTCIIALSTLYNAPAPNSQLEKSLVKVTGSLALF